MDSPVREMGRDMPAALFGSFWVRSADAAGDMLMAGLGLMFGFDWVWGEGLEVEEELVMLI